MAAKHAADSTEASKNITEKIKSLADWRGETLSWVRKLVHDAVPGIVEEWKWMGTPVWSHDGIVCTGESYKQVVKLTFAQGASLPDPHRLFNSSLDGNVRRAIDIREGERPLAQALSALFQAAAAANSEMLAQRAAAKTARKKAAKPRADDR